MFRKALCVLLIALLSVLFFKGFSPDASLDEGLFSSNFMLIVHDAKKVSESILEKATHMTEKGQRLQQFLSNFEIFVQKVVVLEGVDDEKLKHPLMAASIYRYTSSFFDFTRDYAAAMKSYPQEFPEDLALEVNGYPQFRADFEKYFPDFADKFTVFFDHIVTTLTPEEKLQVENFDEFLKNFHAFKNETDIDKRFAYLKVLPPFNGGGK